MCITNQRSASYAPRFLFLLTEKTADISESAELIEAHLGLDSLNYRLLLLGREKVGVANLGDSRIYLVDASGIRQLSQDHVMPAPAGHKPPLLQYLGIPEHEMRLEPNIIERPAAQGETYLMCSDGLTDMVPVDKIESTIRGAFSLPQAAQQLLDRALGAGGRDNITLVLCQIHISHGGLRGLLDHVFG